MADLGVVLDRIKLPAPLEPPIAVFETLNRAEFEVLLFESARPGGPDEGLRGVVFSAGEEDGAAEGLTIGRFLRERLAVVGPGLAANVVVGSGLGAQAAVPGAVGEETGADDKLVLGGQPHGAG